MPEAPKTPKPDPDEIIELVEITDWRFVALALILGGLAVFALLAMLEHTDSLPQDTEGEPS